MSSRAGNRKASGGQTRSGRIAKPGRVTTAQQPTGRYTQPIPNMVRHSPRWYPYALLLLLFLGVLTIILNYIGTLPNSPTNWYTLGALVAIVVAALAATNYR